VGGGRGREKMGIGWMAEDGGWTELSWRGQAERGPLCERGGWNTVFTHEAGPSGQSDKVE
jgi:hypothetical protein